MQYPNKFSAINLRISKNGDKEIAVKYRMPKMKSRIAAVIIGGLFRTTSSHIPSQNEKHNLEPPSRIYKEEYLEKGQRVELGSSSRRDAEDIAICNGNWIRIQPPETIRPITVADFQAC